METIFERWYDSRPWVRGSCWLLASAVFAIGGWGFLLRPVYLQLAEHRAQRAEITRNNALLWPLVRKVPRQMEMLEVRAVRPFSPLDFQAPGGTKLVHWKPRQRGGELALAADWAQIPAVFSRLAQGGVTVSEFNIVPQDATLRLNMQLELHHAE